MRPVDPLDRAVRDAILDSLEWTEDFEIDRLGVTVTGGVVAVSGSVASQSERLAAERAVDRVRGVVAVVNDLAVIGSPSPP